MADRAQYPTGRISIHALHEESDGVDGSVRAECGEFQSTLSMRRATNVTDSLEPSPVQFQSTLSMRRATDYINHNYTGRTISIHALHEESDLASAFALLSSDYFNPRSP